MLPIGNVPPTGVQSRFLIRDCPDVLRKGGPRVPFPTGNFSKFFDNYLEYPTPACYALGPMNEDHPIYKAIDSGGGQCCDISGILRALDAAGYVIVSRKPAGATSLVEHVARASFACWNERRGLSYTFEDLAPGEHEFALLHARTMIEAMRVTPELCYDDYRCEKRWRALNSTEVFNLWIDAALRE